MWYFQVVEQAKAGSPDICVQAFFHLFQSTGDIGAQLNGLTLLRHVLRNRWDALSPEQQQELEQYITSIVMSTDTRERAPPIRMQLAYAISDVVVQSGDQSAQNIMTSSIPQLVQQSEPPSQLRPDACDCLSLCLSPRLPTAWLCPGMQPSCLAPLSAVPSRHCTAH